MARYLTSRLVFKCNILFLLIVILLGCSYQEKQLCNDIDEKFKEVSRDNTLHVYIDASESLRGFVAFNNSWYFRFASQILPSYLGGKKYRLYKFGNTVVNVNAQNIANISQGWFYSDQHTIFSNLLNQILQAKPSGFIIITDMVISSGDHGGGERNMIINNIGELSRIGYKFKLIGIKSKFSGRAFSEIKNGAYIGRFYSSVDGIGKRPFYLLIGYKNSFIVEDLIRFLKPANTKNIPEMEELSLGNYMANMELDFRGSDFTMLAKGNKCWVMRWRKRGQAKGEVEGILHNARNIKLTGIIAKSYPSFKAIEEHRQIIKITREPKVKSKQMNFRMQIEKIPAKNIVVFYNVDLLLKDTRSNPKWIENWSISDDSDIKNYGRTFGLRELVLGFTGNIVSTNRFYFIVKNS